MTELDQLRQTLHQIFERAYERDCIRQPVAGEWDAELWRVLADGSFTTLSVDARRGGSGGTVQHAAELAQLAGRFAVRTPVAHNALVGAWLLAALGIDVSAAPVVLASGSEIAVRRSGSSWHVTGHARARFGRTAGRLLLRAECPVPLVVVLDPSDYRCTPGENLAGEQADEVRVNTVLADDRLIEPPTGVWRDLRRREALAHILPITGAATQAVELSVEHAHVREQFGRPIGAFQAVAHELAVLVGQLAVLQCAADTAVDMCSRPVGELDEASVDLHVTAALVEAGRCASLVAAAAHQIHGAIGITLEHRLRLSTTRLWSWRDELGDERGWRIGLAELSGPGDIWAALTR